MIARYHQEKQQNRIKAEKEEASRLKRIAGNMAKMVKEFWNNIEKVIIHLTCNMPIYSVSFADVTMQEYPYDETGFLLL